MDYLNTSPGCRAASVGSAASTPDTSTHSRSSSGSHNNHIIVSHGAIIIHEVYPDSAASKDGRLKPGDQLLEVNSENFQDVSHNKALALLRQTPAKVRMLVYREEGAAKEEDVFEKMDVQMVKRPGKGLGLSIVGRKKQSRRLHLGCGESWGGGVVDIPTAYIVTVQTPYL
ncbi:multiple PDZ domain protein-like [Amphibalanus amphitrite]|uniref:multiple PDZ domain protein-like n=1 Tax=Amphibalanus amphitrite TaxID=1232801 RepID=UPI001C91226C|nr:multiple PDZ domain protein-like [Amphibalanus amphitrite]